MKILGTIVLGEDKKSMFLVKKDQPMEFPSIIEEDESKTPLGVILNYYLNELGVNPDYLRLEELSMVKAGEVKQNLFVFSINSHIKEVKAACLHNERLEFADVSTLKELFKTIEMDTTPFFN
ncbi:hypothetical protein [Paucilactobacillus nenjiangensis]|jgi:hypothetical protein|uniref:Uncharacterized protein n=1 Tax=Paucilactobacillus nenjiangensis TaxID=1296540 RepID=A0A5P1X676_9LACO|nr:hypothetical protein [Paucilactobacillus nenjiangensis]QER67788.1 hypothetical protein F0161_08015 [Paucilactobacillus nenjiangensis]